MNRQFILLIVIMFFATRAHAQDTVTVPDVSGMNVPQVAAVLNLLGLNLGNQVAVEPQEGQQINTVVAMSPQAGAQVARGTVVDVNVVLPPNLRLIYDDNDLTIMNLADTDMNLGGVTFRSTSGNAAYNPSQVAGVLDTDDCIQIWSVLRNAPKDVAGCDSFSWRSTSDTSVHFWTQANAVESFSVLDNGIERTICPAAPPNSQDSPSTCDVYISGGGMATGGDVAPFVYLAYTANAIAFINPTQDQWMVTDQTPLVNNNPNISNPGTTLIFGDPNLLREEFTNGVGDITRLAPQQCIMFTTNGITDVQPPENCMVIAQRPLDASVAFWLADFAIRSSTTETELTCPAARTDEQILCIGPR